MLDPGYSTSPHQLPTPSPLAVKSLYKAFLPTAAVCHVLPAGTLVPIPKGKQGQFNKMKDGPSSIHLIYIMAF